MDIYTLNKAKRIQDNLELLKTEKEIWENATDFCNIEVWSRGYSQSVKFSYIDFTELKNRSLAYLESKIEELENEFAEL